jgi:putative ABC transport system ATP-binding protein
MVGDLLTLGPPGSSPALLPDSFRSPETKEEKKKRSRAGRSQGENARHMIALECRGLTKELPSGSQTLSILAGVDLAIEAGEFVAILGPSGSGKTTLLGLLAGLDRPSAGEVHLEGRRIDDLSEDELAVLRRGRVGFVFQSFQLLGNLTALENVCLPLELVGVARARERAIELLGEVGLADRLRHYPAQLSGGEQQRVALARAFASEPSVLFADEPTGNLDAETGARVLAVLDGLRARRKATLVLVTHDPEVAARADRRVHLRAGRIERIEETARA